MQKCGQRTGIDKNALASTCQSIYISLSIGFDEKRVREPVPRFRIMKVMPRSHNFNAGPAVLPLPVLERVREELPELPDAGASVMELSHRSKRFETIAQSAENRIRTLLGLPEDFRVLFLQGGASLQFSMAPMNLLGENRRAGYLLTGDWGRKAFKEAQLLGDASVIASTEDGGFRRVPNADEMTLDDSAKYVHFTSNETIQGVQWASEPETADVKLVCDASSDILSRSIDVERYGLIYAGAQKNIGPAGVTVVIVREDWLPTTENLPTMLDYRTHIKSRSLYNTPNTFGIYLVDLVCEWIANLGGLSAIEKRNQEKAKLIYDCIDHSDGFYRGHAEIDSRSQMNVTFRLREESLEAQFLSEAAAHDMMGLPGHRDVGGVRASLYNALPIESAQVLAGFMNEFAQKNG